MNGNFVGLISEASAILQILEDSVDYIKITSSTSSFFLFLKKNFSRCKVFGTVLSVHS